MADFTEDLQSLMYPNIMDTITQFTEQSLSIIDHSNSFMPLISNDTFFCQNESPEFPGNLGENIPGISHQTNHNMNLSLPISQSIVTTENEVHENNKRKAVDVSAESSCTANSSSPVKSHKNNCGRRKRVKSINNEKEEVKPKEVVHVRARRGQATDSHSLAERVRRGKINERLKCLQDIVPGCYKTMGMAVMLDEIINYVQSLQNQVEFLSMKLSAASTFYDFNQETDAIDTMQRAKAKEAKELERLMMTMMMREGYGGGLGVGCSSLTWPF
ncbi:hypothetical protein Dsin_005194 [Dipteronia sinensis]|uniref:BHLH domain-containing protein n=1 Tax=Dipteronia sinensis TaxID=43782 RepID=A0AAE0AWG1_9ROSI|nr:hypothetical protein Dsin_005194 [Dipteronia sinensis]